MSLGFNNPVKELLGGITEQTTREGSQFTLKISNYSEWSKTRRDEHKFKFQNTFCKISIYPRSDWQNLQVITCRIKRESWMTTQTIECTVALFKPSKSTKIMQNIGIWKELDGREVKLLSHIELPSVLENNEFAIVWQMRSEEQIPNADVNQISLNIPVPIIPAKYQDDAKRCLERGGRTDSANVIIEVHEKGRQLETHVENIASPLSTEESSSRMTKHEVVVNQESTFTDVIPGQPSKMAARAHSLSGLVPAALDDIYNELADASIDVIPNDDFPVSVILL
jgi:hypothetical protein